MSFHPARMIPALQLKVYVGDAFDRSVIKIPYTFFHNQAHPY